MVIDKLLSVGQPVWDKINDYCPCELIANALTPYNRRPFHTPVMRDIYELFVDVNLLKAVINGEVRMGVPPTSDK